MSLIGHSSDRLAYNPLVVACRDNVRQPSRLMIVAHPDDESLFGGEALISFAGWMVVCVTNAGNAIRRDEFEKAMTSIGANYVMLDHADHLASGNFDPELERQLAQILREAPWEMIVTHNKDGEYGHAQHKALHRMVARLVPGGRFFVFGTRFSGRGRISPAKARLLSWYASQDSIRRYRNLASREQLRSSW